MTAAPPVRRLGTVRYDPRSRRYVGPNGRFLSPAQVLATMERQIEATTERMVADAEALQAGRISLAQWQLDMERAVKQLHLMTASIEHGGFQQLNQSDLGWIGSQVRRQYEYLRNFARQVESGAQPLDGRLLQRVRMYAAAARATQREAARRLAKLRGATRERWVLSVAEHCTGKGSCIEQASRGAVPLGRLPKIGSRLCAVNCKCRILTDVDERW